MIATIAVATIAAIVAIVAIIWKPGFTEGLQRLFKACLYIHKLRSECETKKIIIFALSQNPIRYPEKGMETVLVLRLIFFDP